MKKLTLLLSALLMTVMSFAGVVTFDADADKGNAGTDSNNATAYTISKDGVTLEVSQGILGTYNNENHYRIYKNQTLKITSTAGAITSVQFTCTANGDTKYGPGCFTASTGEYGHDGGAVGTWTGSATEITFSASTNQVRASQIVVAIDGAELPDTPDTPDTPDNPDTPPVDPGQTTIEIPAEAQGWNIPAGAIDVLQARAICAGLASGATSGTKYYVMGYVKKLHEKYHESGVSGYGNATFYMENVKGAGSMDDFLAFQVYGPNGQKITDPNVVAEGDFVVVYGELTNYNGTYETTGKGSAYIWNSTNSLIGNTTPSNEVTVTGLAYGEAYYYESDNAYEFMLYNFDEATEELLFPIVMVGVEAKSKTAINGTYDLIAAMYATGVNADDEAEGVYIGEEVGTLTIKNVDSEGNYSFVGSFVGEDGKTYKVNTVANVYAIDDETGDDIELKEETETPPTPPTPPTDGALVFDADVDMGNATTDYNQAAAFQVSKNGVTLDVTKGCIGVYNNENHYRIYKNETLTVTSTAGNIAKIEFTCTANDDAKYGPGCFTVTDGEYNYSGAVGTWTGDAATVTFTASTNQVRATQIVVTLASATAVEDVTVGATPVKVIENGQLMIIRGEKVYNVLGAQVK